MNMTGSGSELADASQVKSILEKVTGDRYVLKTKEELTNPEGRDWYIHIVPDISSDIQSAYSGEGKLVFRSPTVYDVYHEIEHEFSESKYTRLREQLGEDIARLQDVAVRQKYRRLIPRVASFFDKIEEIISQVNRDDTTLVYLNNYYGSIFIGLELEGDTVRKSASMIEKNIEALKESVELIVDWLNQQNRLRK
jgi:hypothetical protein